MWDTYNEDREPRADVGRLVRIAVFVALGVIIFSIVGNQSVSLIMSIEEFGEVFTRPIYYETLSGVILAAIVFARVNFRARHSVAWYGIMMLINLIKRGDFESPRKFSRYSEFQMSSWGFAIWQLTKVAIFTPLFANIMFGMTIEYVAQGNDIGLGSLGAIFSIPFADLTADGSYARQNVVPALPALTLLIPALLATVGLRLLIYVGISGAVNVVSQYALDSKDSKPKFLFYISTIEIVAGVAIFWIGFNLFFSSNIDYNTRYAIAGALSLGAALLAYGFLDRRHAKVIIYPNRRQVYSRLFTAAAITGLAGSIMIVNWSIADANKEEWNGPYIAQQIELNHHMHGLDEIETRNYDIAQPAISPSHVQSVMGQNSDLLDNIRLWDEATAKTRLEQEIGHRSDLAFVDFDLLRFRGTSYWAGSTVPVIPASDAQENTWFAQHFKYTHSDAGIKMLDADSGRVANDSQFFEQQRLYYGESEGGLFSTYWSTFPVDRQRSDELGGFFYNGTGGVSISPPLSWMFEPNFVVSESGMVHIMRYKDIHERMEYLYPYFVYEFNFGSTSAISLQPEDIEAYPVTDGTKTYWLMPLIVAINTSNVPWSSATSSSFMLQLVGYSLTDAYDGTIQIFVTGSDYFSNMFLDSYSSVGATREIPAWLAEQIRYPEEMFIWQISKFNTYHVSNPGAYIEAKDFYAVAEDSFPYYTFAKPQGYEDIEFLGFQLLQMKEPRSSNLIGYVAAENDLEDLGSMTFYSIPPDSPVRFINPATAKTTLQGNAEYKEAKRAIFGDMNPPIGEVGLYRVGDYEVYFVPVFSDTAARQVGIVGAVGAASSTGSYHVGLGDTPARAFENYLQKLSGAAIPEQPPAGNQTSPDLKNKIENIERIFNDAGLEVVIPTAISVPVEFMEAKAIYHTDSDLAQVQDAVLAFIQEFAPQPTRIYEWQNDSAVNFGILRQVDGIIESHFISIEVG